MLQGHNFGMLLISTHKWHEAIHVHTAVATDRFVEINFGVNFPSAVFSPFKSIVCAQYTAVRHLCVHKMNGFRDSHLLLIYTVIETNFVLALNTLRGIPTSLLYFECSNILAHHPRLATNDAIEKFSHFIQYYVY